MSEEKKQDETVPGGRFGTPGGGWVDAEGRPLKDEKKDEKAETEKPKDK